MNGSNTTLTVHHQDGLEILTYENRHLRMEIAPALGGRILSIYNKDLEKEFVYRDGRPLKELPAGADYDAAFGGGIDELIPNDIPEEIDGISYPDHGELWTAPLQYRITDAGLMLWGTLKLSGLYYERVMSLQDAVPVVRVKYRIRNEAGATRHFLWKLHAALSIKKGDRLLTSARKARVVSPEASRYGETGEFNWPFVGTTDVSVVPELGDTMDFFYLFDIPESSMKMLSEQGSHLFGYSYDKSIFPYQWYFASYGGFLDHPTVILEPATGMPVSVNESMKLSQCMKLNRGEEIDTTVLIYAGRFLEATL